MLFPFFSLFYCPLFFPFLELTLAFFGFKKGADIRHHIINYSLKNAFRHAAFCTLITQSIFDVYEKAFPKSAVLICLNVFPVRYQTLGNFFSELTLDFRQSRLADHFNNFFFTVLPFHLGNVKLFFKN